MPSKAVLVPEKYTASPCSYVVLAPVQLNVNSLLDAESQVIKLTEVPVAKLPSVIKEPPLMYTPA